MTTIDLTDLKRRTAALPDSCLIDDEAVGSQLEALSAVLFHANFPMRAARAEVWIKAHPEPKAARRSLDPFDFL